MNKRISVYNALSFFALLCLSLVLIIPAAAYADDPDCPDLPDPYAYFYRINISVEGDYAETYSANDYAVYASQDNGPLEPLYLIYKDAPWLNYEWYTDASLQTRIDPYEEMVDVTTVTEMHFYTVKSQHYELRGEDDSGIKWLLSDGMLTILPSDSGYGIVENRPWYQYRASINELVVQNGITEIGYNIFSMHPFLSSVSLPETLTKIGTYSFFGCKALRTIELPESLEELGDAVFCKSGLVSIRIPQLMTEIPLRNFEYTQLRRVDLPANLESVGYAAFNGCNELTDVYYSNTQTHWNAINFESLNEPLTSAEIHFDYGEYTVVYKANGGTGAPADQTKTYGETLTLSSVIPTRDNSSADNYIITLNANGGNVAQSSLSAARTESYTFKNWNTAANGSGTSYSAGANYTADEDLTLYAQWNSSTSTTSVTLPIPSRTGYIFQGWATSSSASSGVKGDYTPTGNVTLYAVWTADTYTVTFDANGGSVSTSSKTVSNGSTYGDLPTPTRSEYGFDGWFTSSIGGTHVTGSTTVNLTANQTLYAHWIKTYTVTYSANGGTGTPSQQIKEENVPLTLSSIIPSKKYIIQFNSNGGSVSPASKNVSCTFNNWNTSITGSGTSYAPGSSYTTNESATLHAQWANPKAGTLATPTRSSYEFVGWFTSASGGTQVTESTIVTGNLTLYARWMDPYNMGDETYSFENYSDSDSPGGHCFGMSMTSAGYHLGLLDIARIGGNANKSLYSFSFTQIVKQPICYYAGIQGKYRDNATVAGGSSYLYGYSLINSDWQEVVNYVSNHEYDNTGRLQIGFRKNGEGGHAINFLRYEKVNGQDRLYAYDNNFPTRETYFYQDSSGYVRQAPVQTFSGPIDCIALRDCIRYFNNVGNFDNTHVLYMPKDAAIVQGYNYSYMEGGLGNEEYVMYEIPTSQDRVTIIPNRDHADFIYMDTEYSFGEITYETRGELKFATMDEHGASTGADFKIYEVDPMFGEPNFTLPGALTEIGESAFEGIAAKCIYVPDTCTSIGAYAFRNASVQQIRIPAKCSIADSAFDGCAEVEIFGTPDSPAESFCNRHDNCRFITETK